MRETYDVTVAWRGFQLHPEIPVGGLALTAMYGRRADKMRARAEAFAAEMGVEMVAPTHAASTIAPLAATELARDEGALEPMRDALMDAYWLHGRDIESPEVLAEIGDRVGLDGDAVARAATEDRYVARVAAARDEAHGVNVSAIPTLLVRGFPIVGCQPWDVYDKVLTKLDVPRRD